MSLLCFVKVQGLGNDFVLIDARAGLPPGWPGHGAAARALCDRHLGIGADGMLLVEPSVTAAACMRVINADGSEAEMCGNGLRCVAAYLWDGRTQQLTVETGAGVLSCAVRAAAVGAEVTIAMGRAQPRFIEEEFVVSERCFRVTALSLGNPHAVLFIEDREPLRALAERWGPALERHPRFPQHTNVEFAHLRDDGAIDLVVWERGCGITLACGTGACATVAAAVLVGHRPAGEAVLVHLPGGTLRITATADLSALHMAGPAREVFRGTVDLAALLR